MPGLADIAGFIGGSDSQNSVQAGLSSLNLGEIAIDDVKIGFNLTSHKLSTVSLRSHMIIDNVRFDLFTSLPNFEFGGTLARNSHISIKQLVAYFLGDAEGFPDIQLDNFAIQTQPSQGYYSIATGVSGDIFIIGPLSLNQMTLYLERSAGKLEGSISATFSIGRTDLMVLAQYDSPSSTETKGSWTFVASSGKDQQIDVGALFNDIASYFDVEIPDVLRRITVQDIRLSFSNALTSTFTFSLTASVPVSDTHLDATLDIVLTRNSEQNRFDKEITGKVKLGDAEIDLHISATDQTAFTLSGQDIDVDKIITTFAPELEIPSEIPTLILKTLALNYVPSTGAFGFSGTSTITWTLPFGVSTLNINQVAWQINRTANQDATPGQYSVDISLVSAGAAQVIDGVIFKSFTFHYTYSKASNWMLSGGVESVIFEQDLSLSIALTTTATERTISLNATDNSSKPLITFSDIGSLAAQGLSIQIIRSTQSGGDSTVKLDPSSPSAWNIQASGRITLTDAFTLAGTLNLYKKADSVGLVFKSTDTEAKIALPIPNQTIDLHIGLDSISIIGKQDAENKTSWELDTAADVWFSGLPKRIQDILADKTSGYLTIGSSGFALSIDHMLKLVEFAIPPIDVGSLHLDFGTAAFEASKLALGISSTGLVLSLDFGCGLPSGLNALLGTNSDHKPLVELFNVYEPGNEKSVNQFRLSLDTTNGLGIQAITSPIKAIALYLRDKDTWCNLDLGDFGQVSFMMPVFSYDGTAFKARGAFEQVKPLKIPLTPVKMILNAAGLGSVAQEIPNGLPLKEITIYDEQTGQFRFDEFIKTLESLGGFTLPDDVKNALQVIESRLDQLPDRFKTYLNIQIPDKFAFDISITPDGGMRGYITVDKDHPIRLLYPTMGPLGPQLMGIELYGITIGEILSGSLLILSMDFRVDQFNLLEMLAAAALPLEDLPILSNNRLIMNHTIVQNLFMLIIYQAGIPIPVPLFFDELGLEYLGLEGVTFQTHWKFPKPKLNMADVVKVFVQFEKFVTDRQYLLDENIQPGFDLTLTIGPHFLQLPKYLGGKMLGSPDDVITISLYKSLAHLFNFFKTFSLNQLIQSFPLDKRVGSEQVVFGPLTLSAAWLITTPEEFRQVSYQRLNVTNAQVEPILAVLPPSPRRGEEGLVVFLRGAWQVTQAASLDVTFGLIGDEQGFGTGLSLVGGISDLFHIDARGVIVINPKASDKTKVFSLNGHTYLDLLDYRFFTGDLQVDTQHFFMAGSLSVFPHDSAIQITGDGQLQIDNQGQVYLHTDVTVTLAKVTLANSDLTLTNTSLSVIGSLLGTSVTFNLQKRDSHFILQTGFSVTLNLDIDLSSVGLGTYHLLNYALSGGVLISLDQGQWTAILSAVFQFQVPGLGINIGPYSIIIDFAKLDKAFTNLADLIKSELHSLAALAADLGKALLTSARAFVALVRQGIITLVDSLEATLERVFGVSLADLTATTCFAEERLVPMMLDAKRPNVGELSDQQLVQLRRLRKDLSQSPMGLWILNIYNTLSQPLVNLYDTVPNFKKAIDVYHGYDLYTTLIGLLQTTDTVNPEIIPQSAITDAQALVSAIIDISDGQANGVLIQTGIQAALDQIPTFEPLVTKHPTYAQLISDLANLKPPPDPFATVPNKA